MSENMSTDLPDILCRNNSVQETKIFKKIKSIDKIQRGRKIHFYVGGKNLIMAVKV